MKRSFFTVLAVLVLVVELYSQDYIQQSNLEMRKSYDDNKTYVCEASSFIKLLPGFQYAPAMNNDMSLDIDRYSVFPPTEGYYEEGTYCAEEGVGAVVGSIPATFNVNNNGAAVYSVDIQLPSAIGTMMPKLSVIYNNQRGNGLMGWSWDVGGLSVISRVGQTEYYDCNTTSVDFKNDRFAIDGKRLMALEDVEYGANGTVYKTEFDNMDKVVSYTANGYKGPEYFVVWKSDGKIWEYGATKDSRMEPVGSDKMIHKWMLNKISDRNGNAVLFHYDINNATGESYIDNIEYTVNEDNGVAAAYKVVFIYDGNRADSWSGYDAGVSVACGRLLKNIHVLKNDTQKVLFDYSFEYDEPAYYGNRYFLHYRLKSIGLTVDGKKINPTKIVWNNEKKHYPQSQGYRSYELNKNVFSEIPFVGDFNGDGLSDVLTVPYKIQDTYSEPIKGKVYLNDGDGSFKKEAMTSLSLPVNLDWIYVLDMNGDGKDDIITYEYNYDYEDGDDVLVTLSVYLMRNGAFAKKASYSYNDNVSITSGNFILGDKNGAIVFTLGNVGKKEKEADYITCWSGTVVKNRICNIEPLDEREVNNIAIDMNGDGVAELISMEENGTYIHNLVYERNTGKYSLKYYNHCIALKKDAYTFPNDFNGDGKTDVLYYDSRTRWNMLISKGDGFAPPVSCTNTNLLRYVTLNPQDRYRCSLKEMMEPTVTIRTADFDGDGISDVAVFKNTGGNYYLQVGFLPYVRDADNYDFSNMCRYYAPINYSHQAIHIGRFLPQENVSFISSLSRKPYASEKPYIVSLYPHSSMYSVERIIDGLGNIRGLCYDCLMNRKNSGFYSSDNSAVDHNMRKTGVPLMALKADTIFNTNEKPIVTTYKYNNAVLHTRGHGFMGFEKTVMKTIVNKECVQKQVQETEFETMGKYCALLPYAVKIFQGDTQLIKEIIPTYKNYWCNGNSKVVMPLLVGSQEIEYDLDKQNRILKKTIVKNVYQSDNKTDDSYSCFIQLTGTVIGYTEDVSIDDAYGCSYWEGTMMAFDNDVEEWVVNRPARVKKVFGGENEGEVGGVEIFEYDDDNPLKITNVAKIPNVDGNESDSLMLGIDCKYDRFGHLVQQTFSSPSLKYKKTLKYEYGEKYQYRYLTTTIDEMGNEIGCDYDDYGVLTQTVDYNSLVTENVKDPLGIDDKLQLPDGMLQQRSLRWSSGNEYAPDNASYYCWEKCTGKSETMTFYHKNGCELRTVTFDINGNAIFQDKCYDDFGNVIQETMPYYVNDEKMLMSKRYDKYNRLVETRYPDDLVCSVVYDGNKMTVNTASKDGDTRTKIDDFNVKGWLVNTVDIGGNRMTYEYYNDGLVKSVMINDNENTKVAIKYDNNRNRSYMRDPNYGIVRYVHDALGNITKVMTHNGNVSEFEYDQTGRKTLRKEKDAKSGDEIVTCWVYDNQSGKKGTLKKVYNDNHSIEYFYDDKLRLINTKEIVSNDEYSTSYTYDKANRIASVAYPTGLVLLKTYSNSGYEQANHDKEDNAMLWKTVKTNACGLITEYQLGNGVKTVNSYDPKTSLIDNIYTTKGEKILQNIVYEYDGFGNVISRSKKTGKFKKETFEYDEYDRLTKVYLNGKMMSEMSYDNMGNVIQKDVGNVRVLYDAVYDDKKPYNISSAKTDDAGLYLGAEQNIKYSVSDNVVKVVSGEKKIDIGYGCEQTRITMEVDKEDVSYSKVYIDNNEYVKENDEITKLTYLMGPMGVYGVCVIGEDGSKSVLFVHKDNIDSWNVITDNDGEQLQRLSFDAWGNARNPDDWYSEYPDERMMFDRGYTGHEHLNDFGLINMNGRMYDPVMSMMISPDNNVQMPQMSQNFNRYSYCLNNPLKYNDPTGEWVESVLLGVVFGASNVVFNADKIDTFTEGLLLFGSGFVQGFLTEYTMGQSWYVQVGANTLTGALKSGVNEMVSIGDGGFNFSGDDWNAVAKASCYGLGSSLVKSVFNSYVNNPTEDYAGDKLQYLFFGNEEVGHAMTSLMAHGMGCWFSGQPMLSTMKFKDVGFDLGMLSIVATRLMRSYIYKSDFADKVVEQRTQEIKDRIMKDILSEDPDYGDFEMRSELSYVDISAGRVYVSGNIFAMLPGEMFKEYPKPYLDEVVSFPFSYSLFRTLFFNK